MNDIKRWSIAELRYAGGAEHDVKYVSEVDYKRVRHAALELLGAIDEYRALPCSSLGVAMIKTADRYRNRLLGGNGDFDQSALAAVLQAELDQPERPVNGCKGCPPAPLPTPFDERRYYKP